MRKVRFSVASLAVAALVTLCGCNAPKDHLQAFNTQFQTGDYANSCLFAQKKISGKTPPKGEDLLWTLQLASVERMCKDYPQSLSHFDSAEDMMKHFDLKDSKVGDAICSTAINDNAVAYKGQEYDGIMMNTYKALDFMAIGNMDNARVEINRALDRQRRAKEKFNAEIQKVQNELNEQKNTSKQNVEDPKVKKIIEEKYPNLHAFEAYPDFVNPFATYVAGMYYHCAGEYSKASEMIKETYGMMPQNTYLADELVAIESNINSNKRPRNRVWFIFENGLCPEKKEVRIDLPLFIATSKVQYAGIALPRLESRQKAFEYLTVEADGQQYKTLVVSDMDRVIQTEFKKEFPAILTRAIISATGKAAAQYAMQQNSNSVCSIIMAGYSFATTAADVRMWTTLPKEFQIAALPKPADNILKVYKPDATFFDVEIPDCTNAIVYIKAVKPENEPIVEVIKL